jgi:hypothetical protein
MKTIKFSHFYLKFGEKISDGSEVALVGVQRVFLQNLTKQFLDTDTAYINKDGTISHYELPKSGEYLHLTFRMEGSGKYAISWEFSTLRRLTPQKAEYYSKALGETFKVEITEEDK